MRSIKTSSYFLLYGSYLIYSISAVFSKYAAKQIELKLLFLFLCLEILFLGVYAIIYQQALKAFPLSVALSTKGITVALAMIWSVAFFGESIKINNIIGVAFIVVGIGLVSVNA